MSNTTHTPAPPNTGPTGKTLSVAAAAMHAAQGVRALNNGDAATAVTALSKAISLEPDGDELYYNRGIAQHDMGDYTAAVADFTQSLELLPDDPYAYLARGAAYTELGDLDDALADAQRVIALDRNFEGGLALRGAIYLAQNQVDNAIDDLTEEIALHRARPRVYLDRGLAYSLKEQWADAIADFTTVVTLEPDNKAAWQNRGLALLRAGRLDEAIRDLDRAIEMDPGHPVVYKNRAEAHLSRGDHAQALDDATRALTLDPSNALAHLERAGALLALGLNDEAISDCNTALKQIIGFPDVNQRRVLARACVYVAELERSPAEAPAAAMEVTYRLVADLAERLGEDDTALEYLERLVYARRADAEAHVDIAQIHLLMERYGQALEHAETAIELDPALGLAYRIRGAVRARSLGQFTDAIEDLRKALELCSPRKRPSPPLSGRVTRPDGVGRVRQRHNECPALSRARPARTGGKMMSVDRRGHTAEIHTPRNVRQCSE